MANSAFEEFQRTFEMFFNQERADSAAVRTIFQLFLVSMFGNHPQGKELLGDLRSKALAMFEQPSPAEASGSEQAKMRQATKLQVERFFDELGPKFPGLQVNKERSN